MTAAALMPHHEGMEEEGLGSRVGIEPSCRAWRLKLCSHEVKVEPTYNIYFFFSSSDLQGQQINEAACDLAREVANEGDALVAGGVSQTPSYLSCKSQDEVKATFKKQLDVFIKKNVDFLIAEVKYLIFKATVNILLF